VLRGLRTANLFARPSRAFSRDLYLHGMPDQMRAIVFDGPGLPLRAVTLPVPEPGPGQLLLRVRACGVCRTDLHLLDGEVKVSSPPRVLGHQIVATVEPDGQRVGVPWLGWSCGECEWCRSGRENLCPRARFTGCDIDGGMAEYAVADARYCFPIPEGYPDEQAAPLLCAGLIGYRALRMCGEAKRIGIFGFGAAAHIIAQVAVWQGREVFAFTRAGDLAAQGFARELGAIWAGSSEEPTPGPLDAAIVFAPDGALVPLALRSVVPGGTVVCGGIHMSDIPSFPYELLWGERTLRSVANLTRADAEQFLASAPEARVRTRVTTYSLEEAGGALEDLRSGRFTGAAVLVP
jgi:propanol-preferring alcohol dehydrogenase